MAIKRITIEFDNRTDVLEGEAAQQWAAACAEQAGLCLANGHMFPDLPWQTEPEMPPNPPSGPEWTIGPTAAGRSMVRIRPETPATDQ
jgi:hypothetical protein